jgi:hypothetical protein
MTSKLAVAALIAFALALQAGFLHAVVATPLASAMHDAADTRPWFGEEILVQAVAKAPPPVVPVRGS